MKQNLRDLTYVFTFFEENLEEYNISLYNLHVYILDLEIPDYWYIMTLKKIVPNKQCPEDEASGLLASSLLRPNCIALFTSIFFYTSFFIHLFHIGYILYCSIQQSLEICIVSDMMWWQRIRFTTTDIFLTFNIQGSFKKYVDNVAARGRKFWKKSN